MKTNDVRIDVSASIMMSFLYAGSSALLISMAQLYSGLWFISLIALIPFLFRAARVSIFESIVLGTILASSYCFVTTDAVTWKGAASFLLKLLCLNVFFILYGIIVNRIVKYIGFNAVFISIFWPPLESGLSHYTHLGNILTFPEPDSTLLFRVSSLFGLLMVFFFLVLINTLIKVVYEYLINASRPDISILTCAKKEKSPLFRINEYIDRNTMIYCLAPRAPPMPP